MYSYSIYIIDDEQSLAKGLALGLKQNYLSKVFSSAEEALPVIKETPPDLVLLDIGLPGMNGVEALREIKKMHHDTIVIMITAFEDIETDLRHAAWGLRLRDKTHPYGWPENNH